MARTATSTIGTPVTLLRNGTVRLARGLTSITKTSPSRPAPLRITTYWMFINPRTPRPMPIWRVYSMIAPTSPGKRLGAG